MKTKLIVLLSTVVLGLVVAGAASAHVTVHPNALPSGGFTVVNVQVPNEVDSSSTVKVDVKLPNGIFFLSTQPVPGWTARVFVTKLAKPVKVFDDLSTQQVSRVVWTSKAGTLGKGQFQSFPMSLLVPKVKAGTVLTFKAVQTYANGKVVRWIGAPSADQPAPQVLITAANAPVEDYPGGITAAKAKALKSVVIGLPLALLGALGIGALRHRMS